MNERLQTQLSGGVRKGELVIVAARPSCINVVKPTTDVVSTMCREIKARQQKGVINEVQNPQ